MHILANISGSKGSQTNKFGQLIECNMSHIFLEKSYTKCSEETSPRTFSEKLKQHIFGSMVCTICFYCKPSWGLPKYIDTKLQAFCIYLI